MRLNLFHWTSDEGADKILDDGLVVQPGALGLVWLTNASRVPTDGLALGTTAENVTQRFLVTDSDNVQPWTLAQKDYDPALWWAMELANGAMPGLWYVSSEPVRVTPTAAVAR